MYHFTDSEKEELCRIVEQDIERWERQKRRSDPQTRLLYDMQERKSTQILKKLHKTFSSED